MRTTNYLLVIIGALGIASSIFLAILDKAIGPNISSFVASLSLVYLGLYKAVPKQKACPVEVKKTKDSF